MSAKKLTKKQKKGLAFRERKQREVSSDTDDDGRDPVSDMVIDEGADVEATRPVEAKHSGQKRKRTQKDAAKLDVVTGGDSDLEDLSKRKVKKRKLSNEPTGDTSKAAQDMKPRFILFVGNLKYTTSMEVIREHFSGCDPPPQIRLLTPKPKSPASATTKSKGCAFLEFSHRNALQQALKLHGSTLDGRRINVELTAGGGGKGEKRVQKVKTKNKQLIEERKARVKKKTEAGNEPDETLAAPPQRHSTTSGMDDVPQKRRTWTVPENGEESGRGGVKKGGRKGRTRPRDAGTGANAIALG